MAPEATAELTMTSLDGLDEEQLCHCARLVLDAGQGYYDLLEADRNLVVAGIAKQLGQPGTELERFFVGLVGPEVAGLHACVSTEILPTVMMEGTLRLLRGFDHDVRRKFLGRLREARASLPALPEKSLYLARIAVSENHQSRGVAGVLMEDFFRRRDSETSYCLHVHVENTRALRFYRRLDFEQFGQKDGGFLAMVRSAA